MDARGGITLFEVLLALAIFLGALAAISQLVHTGTIAAAEGQLQSEAVVRCQAKMGEVVSGIEPLEPVQDETFEDGDGLWTWSLSIGDGPHVDLMQLSVTVRHTRENGSLDASFTVERLIRDPQLYIDAAAAASLETEGS